MIRSARTRRGLPALALVMLPCLVAAESPETWPVLEQERGRWDSCADAPPGFQMAPLTLPDDPDTPMIIDADQATFDSRSRVHDLEGDVEVERGGQRLRADRMRYREDEDRAEARGRMLYRQEGLILGGSQGHMRLAEDQGEMDDVEYVFAETLMQGRSRHVAIESRQVVLLSDATYSTCEPGDELWNMRASRIRLNRESGRGDAWHARMMMFGVPVFYTPYVNFPIDDRRKTGLLPPTLSQSDRTGTDISAPFYWNIAPNYDATIIPRYLSKRGMMLDNEFRYLQNRFNSEGELRVAYLPDDDEFGSDRWSVAFNHRMRLARNLRFRGEFNRVSDDEYFRDLGTSLYRSSSNNLPSEGTFTYSTTDVRARLRTQVFQNLNPDLNVANRPYERVPQLDYLFTPGRTEVGGLPLQGEFYGEAVRFDTPGRRIRDTGNRFDIAPRVSMPFESAAGYVRPALTLRATSYDLDRGSINQGESETVNRVLPLASIDSGLFFDRHFEGFGQNLTQTLEPRLFYLYVPYTDQDDIPLFDTGRPEPNLFQLFSENRFIGGDRVGDTNQVSLGLTSRFRHRDTGREYFRIGVGQAYFLSDRRVTAFADDDPDTRNRSDIITETQAFLPAGFQARTELQWDPSTSKTTLAGARLAWMPVNAEASHGLRPVITGGYRSRFRDDQRRLDIADIAAVFPITRRWSGLGGWRYDSLEGQTIEAFGGLEYRDCCWSIRLVSRYFREEPQEEPDRQILLQFEFRGLGRIGDNVRDLLDETVFGYERLR